MSSSPSSLRDYCDDLLVKDAIYGLRPTETQELDQLIERLQLPLEERFEAPVAALDAGFAAMEKAGHDVVLPTSLHSKILSEASSHVGYDFEAREEYSEEPPQQQRIVETPQPKPKHWGWSSREKLLGFVAVASLLFALLSVTGVVIPNRSDNASAPPQLSLVQAVESLASTEGTQRFAWSNPTNDAAVKDLGGEVVWNDTEQKGYLVLEGLAINDPKSQQYQLWIFDRARSDDLPVDGGVFDVTESGQVIVPIDNKLSITEAKAFAVTIEAPGGVVQSKRERLPLLAGAI